MAVEFEQAEGLVSGWVYSALMDAATCGPCETLDNTEYPTWEAISQVLPGGGPNPECYGNGRCRCMPVPAGAGEPVSEFRSALQTLCRTASCRPQELVAGTKKALFPGPFRVERAGIEPATSGLQTRPDCSRRFAPVR